MNENFTIGQLVWNLIKRGLLTALIIFLLMYSVTQYYRDNTYCDLNYTFSISYQGDLKDIPKRDLYKYIPQTISKHGIKYSTDWYNYERTDFPDIICKYKPMQRNHSFQAMKVQRSQLTLIEGTGFDLPDNFKLKE